MVIFTYEDYLKYKEIQQYTLNLRKELEEEKIWQEKEKQTSYKYELNDVEEDYILKSGEDNQFEVENVEIDKKIIKKVNNEHDKIFRTVLSKIKSPLTFGSSSTETSKGIICSYLVVLF